MRDRAKYRAALARQRLAMGHDEAGAYDAWLAGRVVPDRITSALDLQGLDGPEVDRACGTEEPAVDEWESGKRYPTWDEVKALAQLTGFPVGYFVLPVTLVTTATSFDLHDSWHGRLRGTLAARLLAYRPEVVHATVRSAGGPPPTWHVTVVRCGSTTAEGTP